MVSRTKHQCKISLKALFLITLVINLVPWSVKAQADTLKTFKNTIRINITNPMIFSPKYNVIGYERVIGKHQSFSVSVGRFAMGKFSLSDKDSVQVDENFKDKGFNMSFDYRFYLKSENRHNAPRGVYLGPYYAFNYFAREYTWKLNTVNFTGEVGSTMDLMANLVGVQMGYQFVLWDRLSIDMILLGPGVWFFKMKTDFDTELSPDDETLLLEKLNEMIEEKFPGSDLVIQGGGFEAKKVTSTSKMGLRYMINIGFRF